MSDPHFQGPNTPRSEQAPTSGRPHCEGLTRRCAGLASTGGQGWAFVGLQHFGVYPLPEVRRKARLLVAIVMSMAILGAACSRSAEGQQSTDASRQDAEATPESTESAGRPDEIVGEAIRTFCAEQFDCASPTSLYVVSAYIDSNTELGSEVAFDEATRASIESALGRPVRWLVTPSEVDTAVQESPSPIILTVGKPVLSDYVAEVDIGWSQRPLFGKRVTMSVNLGNQDNDIPQTPRTTSVP